MFPASKENITRLSMS